MPFRPNRWGRKSLSAPMPKIYGIEHQGRIVALLTPFDLLAPAAGHRLHGVAAYGAKESAALIKNLLLWRYAQVAGPKSLGSTGRTVAQRPLDRLLRVAGASVKDHAFTLTAAAIRSIQKLSPGGVRGKPILADFRNQLLIDLKAARRAGRTTEGQRLARILTEFFPDDPEVLEIVKTIGQPRELKFAARLEDTAKTNQAELPVGLATIVLSLGDLTTDARTLLESWFDLEKELTAVQEELETYSASWKALDDRARELMRERAVAQRDNANRSRGGWQFAEIAADRKVIQAKSKKAEFRVGALVRRMNCLTNALRPAIKTINGYGIELIDGRWIKQGRE